MKLLLICLFACVSILTSNHSSPEGSVPSVDSLSYSHASNAGAIENVIARCRESIDGEIVKAEKKHSREITFWEVNIITTSGSAVKLKIIPEEGKIFEAVSSEGPFDYDFNPGGMMVPFQNVRTNAESNAGTRLLKWKLVEAKSGMQYHFWFFTKGGAAQYKVNALTGERIMKKQGRKKKS